jgi:hypothetical protein
MSCCSTIIQQFINAVSTNVGFGAELQAQHGSRPLVQVYYLEGGELVLHQFASVRYQPGNIIVDHGGGPASGFILIK